MKSLCALGAVLGAAIAVGGGCSSDESDHRPIRAPRSERISYEPIGQPAAHREPAEPIRPGDRDWRVREPVVRDAIPASAQLVKEARGTDMAFRADRDGMIYLYDADRRQIVYAGRMRRGEQFVVNTEQDSVSLNGQTVFDQPLNREGRYQLFFSPGDRIER